MIAKPLLMVAAVLIAANPANADEWAHLKGRFLLQGEPPKAIEFKRNLGDRVLQFRDESIIVGKKEELKNVVVWLRTRVPFIAPQYDKSAADTVTLELKDDRFEPHILALRTTQTLKIKNSLNVGVCTKVDGQINQPFTSVLNSGRESSHRLYREERQPMRVGDTISPWLGAFLVVRDDPYVAISGADGKFLIESLPVGVDLEFQVWQEKIGYLRNVVTQSAALDAKGRFNIKLQPGTKDLGDIKVSEELIAPPAK